MAFYFGQRNENTHSGRGFDILLCWTRWLSVRAKSRSKLLLCYGIDILLLSDSIVCIALRVVFVSVPSNGANKKTIISFNKSARFLSQAKFSRLT
jgi:hypothetical protein